MSQGIKASDLLVRALENEGVEYIFGVPGEENLDVVDSLRTSRIKLIITRHEQAAGFMAATYGRLTGKPGVCLATLGPGATNFVTAAAYADLGAMPMLMITGQKPIMRSKQGRFQIIDVVGMMRPITKWAHQIVHAHTVAACVREGFRLATQERPGPVHLELPEDIAEQMSDSDQVFHASRSDLPMTSQGTLEAAVEMIEAAQNPLLLVGAGANRRDVIRTLLKFVDATGINVVDTQMGKGVIPADHPQYLGTTALSDGDYIHCAIERADLVINAGHDVVEKPPFFMVHGGKRVIHVNYNPAQVDEVYFPQLELVGCVASSFSALTERLEGAQLGGSGYFDRVRDGLQEHLAEGVDDPRCPLIPQRIVADVREAMPRDGILTLDNGMYKIWFARGYPAYQPNTILLDNALATMGAGLPSGLMAAMLYPERKVMAICGDGGFMMNSQELETAVRLQLNLVVLILRDDAFGMIRWKQQVGGFADWGLQYGNPDFVAYAESYGARGHRIGGSDELAGLISSCHGEGGVHLIEVPIDYSENKRVLIDELAQRVCVI